MRPIIVRSESFDPAYNLALEEHYLVNQPRDECVLYLWRNRHTIVIGRNQNPWRECDFQALEASGGTLARRSSGGGAVYHDLGNLNFSLILPRKKFDLGRQLELIRNAVASFGIEVEVSGRNDLLIDGKKFSGHAFRHHDERSLHHGTLLLNVDMDAVGRYLRPSPLKLASKGVASVRSRVANLSDHIENLELESLENRLVDHFLVRYAGGQEPEEHEYTSESFPLREHEKYASWEWRFGVGPEFDLELEKKFSWGELAIRFRHKKGRLESCDFFSDAMEPEIFLRLGKILCDIPFRKKDFLERIDLVKTTGPSEREILTDIRTFIEEFPEFQ